MEIERVYAWLWLLWPSDQTLVISKEGQCPNLAKNKNVDQAGKLHYVACSGVKGMFESHTASN
jgi:hypothetical protein